MGSNTNVSMHRNEMIDNHGNGSIDCPLLVRGQGQVD